MSLETDELRAMLTEALTGMSIPEGELTRTGLDVAILEAMLTRVYRHLPYVRGFVGIDDHTVNRFWGGRIHKTALIVPQQGRELTDSIGATLGHIRH